MWNVLARYLLECVKDSTTIPVEPTTLQTASSKLAGGVSVSLSLVNC